MHSPNALGKAEGEPQHTVIWRGTQAHCDMEGLLQWVYDHTYTILTGEGGGGGPSEPSVTCSACTHLTAPVPGAFTKTVPRVNHINSESPCTHLAFLVSTPGQVWRAIVASHIGLRKKWVLESTPSLCSSSSNFLGSFLTILLVSFLLLEITWRNQPWTHSYLYTLSFQWG